jgi:hypothetical protein
MEPGFIRENGKNSKRFGRTKKIMSFTIKKSMIRCFKQLNIIDYSHRILHQILCEKSCNHILVMHLIKVDDDIVIKKMTFIHFKFSFIWHLWLLTKWHGHYNKLRPIPPHIPIQWKTQNGLRHFEWNVRVNKSHCLQVECF